MTTTGKRLDDITLGLTVRERVLLAIRPWLADEEPADGLARNCPEPDRQEMERLFHAIERGNQLLGDSVAFSLEWANSEEITMAWLECLAAFLARERRRPPGGRGLPDLPPPGRGFVRDLPMTRGRQIGEDDPLPDTWERALETLILQMRRNVEVRWRGVLIFEEAFALGSAAFGHDIVHARMRVAVVALRAKVLDLHQAMQPFGAFVLPVLTPAEHQQASDYFDLAALRSAGGAQGPRERLHVTTREKLDAEEATLAAELRAERTTT